MKKKIEFTEIIELKKGHKYMCNKKDCVNLAKYVIDTAIHLNDMLMAGNEKIEFDLFVCYFHIGKVVLVSIESYFNLRDTLSDELRLEIKKDMNMSYVKTGEKTSKIRRVPGTSKTIDNPNIHVTDFPSLYSLYSPTQYADITKRIDFRCIDCEIMHFNDSGRKCRTCGSLNIERIRREEL